MKPHSTSALKAIGTQPISNVVNRALPIGVVEFTNGAVAQETTIKAILHHHAISKNLLNFPLTDNCRTKPSFSIVSALC